MKKTFCFAALLASLAADAQPNIQNMENHTVGDSTLFMIAAPGAAPGGAGANQTWAFAGLQAVDSFSNVVINPGSTQFGAQFPAASFAIRSSAGSYEFFSKTSAETHRLGIVDSVNSTTVTYPDSMLYAVRPYTFGNSANDSYTMTSNPSTTGVGTVNLTADGYGTLQLPGGTYTDVLRVKMLTVENDTVPFGPMLLVLNITGTQYRWYDNNHSFPLMVWDSTHVNSIMLDTTIKNVYYRKSVPSSGVDETNPAAMRFDAHVSDSRISVSGSFDPAKEYTASLYSLSGQVIYSTRFRTSSGRWSHDTAVTMAPGIYLLAVHEARNPRNFSACKIVKD